MTQNLYDERVQNLIDAASLKEPKKVPVGLNTYGWPFAYSGVKYTDIMDCPQNAVNEYVKFLDEIDIDCYYITGVGQPVKAYEKLGCHYYAFSDDGTYVMNPQVNDEYCGTWIYDDIIDDAAKFYNDTYPKIRLPKLNGPRDEAYNLLIEALKEFRKFNDFNTLLKQTYMEEKQLPCITNMQISCSTPLTTVFCGVRGILNTLLDLRRTPGKVYDACDATFENNMKKFNLNPDDFTAPWPWGFSSYHPEGFISPKVYDKIYFKYFKRLMEPFMEKGMKCFLMGEGSFLNTIERFRELPKGAMVIQLDTDDAFEVHKKIGDWATIMCGVKADMLALATKQECVDLVKKYFDVLAPGGGFIYIPNNPLMSFKDAKIENLIAVYETADELSRQ